VNYKNSFSYCDIIFLLATLWTFLWNF